MAPKHTKHYHLNQDTHVLQSQEALENMKIIIKNPSKIRPGKSFKIATNS